MAATAHRPPTDDDPLDAGPFAAWLGGLETALDGGPGSDVPCGTCTGCCTSSQFVLIGPEESDALAHIPMALQFPAPGLTDGHVLLGYDDHGRCPMLVDGACSIYDHRPRTCRTYDCRVFAAAGTEPDEPAKREIAVRVRRWRFTHPTATDRAAHDAVRAAAAFIADHAGRWPPGTVPSTATGRAVLAVQVHHLFADGTEDRAPDPDRVRRAIDALRP